MRGLAYVCFISAVVYALLGMAFGIYMAASHDHELAGAHAHLNLLGWVSMAVYGLFYQNVPEAAESRLAKIQVAVATLGIWLLVPGIALAILGMTEGPAVIGSFVTIAGMLLFASIVARSRSRLAA